MKKLSEHFAAFPRRTQTEYGRLVPPHPGPLPKGEGAGLGPLHAVAQSVFSEALPPILPLPRGEGRGEGERRVQTSILSPQSLTASLDRPVLASLFHELVFAEPLPTILPLPRGQSRGEEEQRV